MTNPLEQIRELAKSWRGAYHSVTERDLGKRDGLIHCSDRILSILDASQGYVCVPVEDAAKVARLQMLLDEAHEHHLACIKDAYELLGIDGSDGDYRYKWVALELHDVKKNAEDAKRLRALERAMDEEICLSGTLDRVRKRADEILRGSAS